MNLRRLNSVCSFGSLSFSLPLLAIALNIFFVLKNVPLGCLGMLWACVKSLMYQSILLDVRPLDEYENKKLRNHNTC